MPEEHLSAYAVGVDAYRGGWVALALDGAELRSCKLYPSFSVLVDYHREASAIAVDIPIGLTDSGSRAADRAARDFVGPRASSVFPTPARSVLEAATYAEAVAYARRRGGPAPSRQSYALAPKILEVDVLARDDARIHEVHPEVSFAAMAGRHVAASKKTWNGLMARHRLLEENGIAIPEKLDDGGRAPADDVLDAAAAAWTARRIAVGVAQTLPDPPEPLPDGRRAAIWY